MADPITPTPAPNVGAPDPNNPTPVPSTGAPATPAPPKGTQPVQDPNATPGTVEPHHSILASVFQDLAGGKKTVWQQTDKGPVPVKQNLAPGEMARGILAAAITGLASGYSAPRGKGPAAAEAFGAGFQGEAAEREKTAGQAQVQAQQQFKNKETSDEMTLRKMQNAREQQESASRLQEHDLRMQQMEQEMAQGKVEANQKHIEFFNKMADNYNALTQAGAKPLTYPDGRPIEEFNSPEEFTAWLHANPKLAIQPGKYNTVATVDPNTGKYVVMQKPVGWDDPQWLGVKKDGSGNPIRDKDGNFTPDGTFKDSAGKVTAPAGMISPHQLYDANVRQLELQAKLLTLEEAKERLASARLAHEKDQQLQNAYNEWNKADGDPDAIDSGSHNFVVSPASRNVLKQTFLKDVVDQNNIIMAAQKEMDRIGEPGKNASSEDRQQWADLNEQINAARTNLRTDQVSVMKLSRVPNIADIQAGSIRKQFTKDDGTYDESDATKYLDSLKVNSGLKQNIRERLSAEYGLPTYNPDQISVMAQQISKAHKPEEYAAVVGAQKMSSASKQALLDALKSNPPAQAQPTPGIIERMGQALSVNPE